MDKEYLTKITNDLYRLTLLFPKKEPLRYKMRELADNILTDLILVIEGNEKNRDLIYEIKKNIEPLDIFFEIAKDQNWVSPDSVLELQDKFNVIREELEEYEKSLKEDNIYPQKSTLPKVKNTVELTSFNNRQKKIIEILKNEEKIQVQDAQKIFPKITKRTLRRDFDSLFKKGAIKRIGKANLTFYKLADREI